MVLFFVGPKSPPPPRDDPEYLVRKPNSAKDYQTLLRNEFGRLANQTDPANATSLYVAYQLGRPLLLATFHDGDIQLRRAMIAHAAKMIRGLPTYEAILKTPAPDAVSRTVDQLVPGLRSARQWLAGTNPTIDGLPMPDEPRLYGFRIFPLQDGSAFRINTGNIHQFGRYQSTLLRLAAFDPALSSDPDIQRDLKVIARYLTHDFLRFYWLEAPAWHWNGAFAGGVRERSLARLNGGPRVSGRRFFSGFLDYDVHLLAVAADLKTVQKKSFWLAPSSADKALVDDVVALAFRILFERVKVGADGKSFGFDRGYWDDNPIAQYGGCQDARLPKRVCPIRSYTTDISHGQRWPAWLESFELSARDGNEAAKVRRLRTALAATVARGIRYREGRLLLPNFLDGRDGWFLTTESKNGANAHPPSSMTGWAMRYAGYAELSGLEPRIAEAQQRFCDIIQSSAQADVQFRMANYGEPEANPANGIRPMSDEYGALTAYASICIMTQNSAVVFIARP